MTKKPKTPEERLNECALAIQQVLKEHKCQMYTALKVGNAETPLVEIAGFPIIVKLASNATET